MSTLAEIEAAIEHLPSREQEKLLMHLSTKLAKSGTQPSGTSDFGRTGRGFPVVSGRVRFGPEDVARIEAEA